MSQWVILDRDGVINHDSDEYIKSPQEWIPIDGSLQAIGRLKKNGYKIAVITNQSGLARGYFELSTLYAMHDKMQRLLAGEGTRIDEIYFCPHGPDDGCDCRKPKPGMLRQLAREHDVKLDETWFVGDTLGDIQAAHTAGARPAIVKTGKGQRTLDKYGTPDGTAVFDSLAHFVDELVSDD